MFNVKPVMEDVFSSVKEAAPRCENNAARLKFLFRKSDQVKNIVLSVKFKSKVEALITQKNVPMSVFIILLGYFY